MVNPPNHNDIFDSKGRAKVIPYADFLIEVVEVSATLGIVGGFDLLLVDDGY